MKKLTLLLSIAVSLLVWSCGNSDSSDKAGQTEEQSNTVEQQIAQNESQYPEGYPEELTVPPGFKANQIKTGSGSSSGMGGERTYKKYEIWTMMPQNAPGIIAHYKKLLADLGYEGEWQGDGENEAARGTFKKGLNELKLSISSEQFDFKLTVWDK